jgi:hypothetical protein
MPKGFDAMEKGIRSTSHQQPTEQSVAGNEATYIGYSLRPKAALALKLYLDHLTPSVLLAGDGSRPDHVQHDNMGGDQAVSEDEEDSVLQLWHQPEHTSLWSDPALPQDPQDVFAELTEPESSMESAPGLSSEESTAAAEAESEPAAMHAQQPMVHDASAASSQGAKPHPSQAAVAQAAAARLGSVSSAEG